MWFNAPPLTGQWSERESVQPKASRIQLALKEAGIPSKRTMQMPAQQRQRHPTLNDGDKVTDITIDCQPPVSIQSVTVRLDLDAVLLWEHLTFAYRHS